MVVLALEKIGIMGGTFNPIHYGHLIAAEWAKIEHQLDIVIFVPAANPPHKDMAKVLNKEDRYNMVERAIASNQNFTISNFEMQREGKSFTVDTLEYFKKIYPKSDLYFIIGYDAFLDLHTWKNFVKLFDLSTFIVATRTGYTQKQSWPRHSHLPKTILDKIKFFEIPEVGISSSDIRQRVRQNKSIKYLVPEAVEKYIFTNNIYGG